MFPSSNKQPSTGAASSNDRPMCVQGDSGGLVLTTDPKPRLRWTAELHDRFVDAIAQLGGPDSTYSIEDMMLPFVYFVGNFIGILIALICFLALFSCIYVEATPKTIMRVMGVKGLTLYHLKSHLQVRVPA